MFLSRYLCVVLIWFLDIEYNIAQHDFQLPFLHFFFVVNISTTNNIVKLGERETERQTSVLNQIFITCVYNWMKLIRRFNNSSNYIFYK